METLKEPGESPKGGELEVRVFGDFESAGHLRESWDKLVDSAGGEIFMSFDWCRTWWAHYGRGRRLNLFVFFDGGRLVGILPLFTERIRWGPVRAWVVKSVGLDFTFAPFIPPIEEEHWSAALRAAFSVLEKQGGWNIYYFGPLSGLFHPKLSSFRGALKSALPREYRVSETKPLEQTYFFTGDSLESYLETLDRKRRRDVRRKYRLLQEALGEDREIRAELAGRDDVDEFYERFYRFHQEHWRMQGKAGHFGDWPGSWSFHRDIARRLSESGRLRLLEVRCGEIVLGYKYAFRFGERLVEFLDARAEDPKLVQASVGNIVFLEQVRLACAEGVRVIDSLRGRYYHKMQMGGQILPMANLFIRRRKSLNTAAFVFLSRLLNLAYYKIWYSRVSPRLPIKKRPLWKSWVRTHMWT